MTPPATTGTETLDETTSASAAQRPRIGFVSLGCPKNLVDSEVMMGMLHHAGGELTTNAEDAEILVVNTCSFIDSAKQESVNTILEMVAAQAGQRRPRPAPHRRRLPRRALPRRDPEEHSRSRRSSRHRRARSHPRRRRPHAQAGPATDSPFNILPQARRPRPQRRPPAPRPRARPPAPTQE